jgi:hypothetical protein
LVPLSAPCLAGMLLIVFGFTQIRCTESFSFDLFRQTNVEEQSMQPMSGWFVCP